VLVYDKAGVGVSDPIDHVPTLEERVEDMRTVMDAVGIERAAIFGESEAGPAAAMFAATYPERCEALIIWGSVATGQASDEELAPYGGRTIEVEELAERLRESIDHWGEGLSADWIMPSIVSPFVRRGLGTFERSAVSPSMARGLIDHLFRIDVRPALGTISAPTLVLHRRGDVVPISHGRLLATCISDARLIELPGSDHAFFTQDSERILGEIQQHLTGVRTDLATERVLATVLFTDIVESTRRAAEAGDVAWRRLLEQHDELARREVAASGGRIVKSLGDGMLAVFAGPARAISCTQSLLRAVEELDLALRAGIHTGECETRGDDLGGIAVHIGARVSSLAGANKILVTQTVVDLVVGSGLQFSERGEYELKGVPGVWRLFEVLGQSAADRTLVEPASEYMTGADRATVRIARRAPGVLRALSRVAQRRDRSSAV
jgi:class 3 adenylate cyclase